MEERITYRVEKFIPTTCPNPRCKNPFTENSTNGFLFGTYWLYEAPEDAEKILASITHPALKTDIIVCGKCHNVVMRVMIEERTYDNHMAAERAVRGDGYLNLKEISSSGPVLPKQIIYLEDSGQPVVRTTILRRE